MAKARRAWTPKQLGKPITFVVIEQVNALEYHRRLDSMSLEKDSCFNVEVAVTVNMKV